MPNQPTTLNTDTDLAMSVLGDNWQLVALSPELGDLSIPVGTSLRIGRQETNDVVLASPRISRQHAKLNRIGDKLYIQDLGSANGTFVNGDRMTSEAYRLQQGDELAFAELAFVVTQQDDMDADALVDAITQLTDNSAPLDSTADTPQGNDNNVDVRPVTVTAPSEPLMPVDIDTTRDTLPTIHQPSDADATTNTTTSVYTITDTSAVSDNIPTKPSEQAPTQTQSMTALADKAESSIPVPPVESTVKVAPVTEAVTQPVTTTATPVPKAETKKMANIAIIIIVLIALAIIASLFI